MNKTLIHHSYVCFSLSAPVKHVACRERGRGTGRWPLRTTARHQGSTLEHVRSAEMKADRPLRALSWVRCPNPGCEVSWGGGKGHSDKRSGYLEGERGGKRERWPRCTACRDLRGPTAWTSRGYFWRGFMCLDATSNPERKKVESIDAFFCVQISITVQTDYHAHSFY